MGLTVAIGLRSIYRISVHHKQETTGVEHSTESAYCIDFHTPNNKGKKNETARKKKFSHYHKRTGNLLSKVLGIKSNSQTKILTVNCLTVSNCHTWNFFTSSTISSHLNSILVFHAVLNILYSNLAKILPTPSPSLNKT
jgi:hypothetical protein